MMEFCWTQERTSKRGLTFSCDKFQLSEEFDDKKLSKVWFARWICKYFEYKQKPFEKGRDSIGKFVKLTTPW